MKEWVGMPEFIQENKMPMKTIFVHFADQKGVDSFSGLIKQKISPLTKSVWYPKAEKEKGMTTDVEYVYEP